MKFRYFVATGCFLVLSCARAAETITVEQIRQLMAATDTAAMTRDTAAIGAHLSPTFAESIDVSNEHWTYTFTLDRDGYLSMIEEGWKKLDDYKYKREDTTINVAADGLSAESRSTITEETRTGDRRSVSRIREYAEYAVENGKPVITTIESFDLVPGPVAPGDTDF